MKFDALEQELVDEGLHEESVARMVDHYEQMRFYLGIGKYPEIGVHVGNFCESLVNVLLDHVGEELENDVSVHGFINRAESDGFDIDLRDELRTTVPRLLQAAYELRSKRNTVHTNLEVPVSHNDAQTAVRLCSWLLCELLYVFGEEEHHDEIAEFIESMATPVVPYIDQYEEKRLIMSNDLDTQQEILVHLFILGTDVPRDDLVDWIPGASPQQIGGTLGSLKQNRKVHYENGSVRITPIGAREAQEIIEEHLEG
jgi:hypothetical protein